MPQTKGLSLDKKLELFSKATAFKVSDDITISHRGAFGKADADKWAIVRGGGLGGGICYSKRDDQFIYEPSPSNRTEGFKRSTRYSLARALEIVESSHFKEKYLTKEI